mgnify:CR=1 FL=1
MKTKRHAAALAMLVVLLIAGSGYVHLANASAQEQALAYGGSIEPLLSAADHLRAFFMDRDFLLAHGMSVPNVNGMCILILYQSLLFNIVEDYRNRTLSSYSLWPGAGVRDEILLFPDFFPIHQDLPAVWPGESDDHFQQHALP